jgi:hypothetical protein
LTTPRHGRSASCSSLASPSPQALFSQRSDWADSAAQMLSSQTLQVLQKCVLTSLHAALREKTTPCHARMRAASCPYECLHSSSTDLYQTRVVGHARHGHGRIVRRATTCVRVTSACSPGTLVNNNFDTCRTDGDADQPPLVRLHIGPW